MREYNNFIFSPDDNFLYTCSINGDISEISIEEGTPTRMQVRLALPRERDARRPTQKSHHEWNT